MVLRLSSVLMFLLLTLPLRAAPPASGVEVEEAWARPTPPAATVAAVYMTLRNRGAADRLLRLASPLAGRVELHQTSSEGGMMRMRQLPFAPVAAGGQLVAAPGGLHVMLLQLKRPLAAGEEFPLTLLFATAGEVRIKVKVRSGS